MDTKILKQIGLTDSEVKVYLSLLELGSTTKGPIVEKSGVASSKIYELLDKLIAKGLVSTVIKSGVKYFESAPPSRLLDYMKEREEEFKNQREKLEHLIPDLELRRSLAGFGSETQVFKGMRGAATSFDDILKELKRGDEYYVLGISKFTPHFERFVIHFHNKRARLGIKCKIIVNETAKNIGKKLEPLKFTNVRYLKRELFTPVVFIIYKEKTLISIGLDEIFIQITSKNLANGMRAYAKYMYSIGKKRTELP
jgi:sugar-specific transcriptional regulator TrmB|tara:strand:- start:84 stop:845 length:762 start_codon:yes stop_codon:yes gene_type:complete